MYNWLKPLINDSFQISQLYAEKSYIHLYTGLIYHLVKICIPNETLRRFLVRVLSYESRQSLSLYFRRVINLCTIYSSCHLLSKKKNKTCFSLKNSQFWFVVSSIPDDLSNSVRLRHWWCSNYPYTYSWVNADSRSACVFECKLSISPKLWSRTVGLDKKLTRRFTSIKDGVCYNDFTVGFDSEQKYKTFLDTLRFLRLQRLLPQVGILHIDLQFWSVINGNAVLYWDSIWYQYSTWIKLNTF